MIAAGTIYNYSFPGLAWLVLAAVAWALLVAWRERGERDGLQLRARAALGAAVLIAPAVAIPLLAALPELIRIISFAGFEAFSPSGDGGNTGFGNLRQALNPLEALGIWPSSEFRIAPAELEHAGARLLPRRPARPGRLRLGARAARSRGGESALPAALAAGALGYLVGARRRHPLYVGEGARDRRARS